MANSSCWLNTFPPAGEVQSAEQEMTVYACCYSAIVYSQFTSAWVLWEHEDRHRCLYQSMPETFC